jgi:hypothetical protein
MKWSRPESRLKFTGSQIVSQATSNRSTSELTSVAENTFGCAIRVRNKRRVGSSTYRTFSRLTSLFASLQANHKKPERRRRVAESAEVLQTIRGLLRRFWPMEDFRLLARFVEW